MIVITHDEGNIGRPIKSAVSCAPLTFLQSTKHDGSMQLVVAPVFTLGTNILP